MTLGLSVYKLGYHRAAWRMPDFPRDSMMNLNAFAKGAADAERAKFDFVFFADIMNVENLDDPTRDISLEHYIVKLDPVVALSALATMTKNIGLVGTISTTYMAPYRIARLIASLDVVSGGRAGWNVVTSYNPYEMKNYGLSDLDDIETRYERAHESIEIVTGLWNSWEEGAFIVDKESGVYLDRSKVNVLNYNGRHLSCLGPLDVARSPQGSPVVVSAGDSPTAREMAAKYSNIQYAPTQGDISKAHEYYRDVKGMMKKHGRHPNDLRILPGLMPIVGETEAEAKKKHEHLRSLIHPTIGLGLLMPLFGDLSGCKITDPLPGSVEPDPEKFGGYAKRVFDEAIADNLTIQQVYEKQADGERWFMTLVGSAKKHADTLEEWFMTEAADGFNILPHYMPGGFDDFTNLVVPELQRRGLFRTEYEGETLRDLLAQSG